MNLLQPLSVIPIKTVCILLLGVSISFGQKDNLRQKSDKYAGTGVPNNCDDKFYGVTIDGNLLQVEELSDGKYINQVVQKAIPFKCNAATKGFNNKIYSVKADVETKTVVYEYNPKTKEGKETKWRLPIHNDGGWISGAVDSKGRIYFSTTTFENLVRIDTRMAEPEVVWSDNIKIKEWSKNNCKEGCNFYINKDDKVVVKENKGRNYWIVNIDDKPFVEKKEMLNIRPNLNPTNDLTEFYGKNDKVQTLILNKDGIKRYFTNQGEFLAIAKIDTARYGILTDLASCNYFNIGDIIKKDDMNEPEEVGIDITKNSKESIRLKSVLFKLGESELMPESYAELNALVRQMKKHTEIEILLEGHTDITGDATENLQLSIDRVDACKRYLVQQGITPFRIQTKGYGSSKPLIRKGSEKEREANRRVEVKVLKNSQ